MEYTNENKKKENTPDNNKKIKTKKGLRRCIEETLREIQPEMRASQRRSLPR